MTDTTPMISIQDVWKRYGRLDVLKGIDLEVPAGTVTCLIGPSGSGKSTLLRCVNHLESIDAGRIEVDGDLIGYEEKAGRLHQISEREASRQRADIGMVFQQFNLFTHRTVLANIIEAPVKVKGVPKAEAEATARELLEMVGLADKAESWPVQLSGGQQQRVAIARALVNNPRLVLADEPTGNLDARNADSIFQLLGELNAAQGTAFLVVTHDLQLAKRMGRQLEMRDGRLNAELTLMGAE